MKKRLYKSATDKKIFGVCGGFGEYFNIDSTWVRLFFVILAFGCGGGIALYIAAAIAMPDASAKIEEKKEENKEENK